MFRVAIKCTRRQWGCCMEIWKHTCCSAVLVVHCVHVYTCIGSYDMIRQMSGPLLTDSQPHTSGHVGKHMGMGMGSDVCMGSRQLPSASDHFVVQNLGIPLGSGLPPRVSR